MLKRIDAAMECVANWILVITGIAVCVLIFAGAFMRYVLHTDFYGSEELILLAGFWMYFVGGAMAAKHDTQIKAEMLDMFIKNPKILTAAKIIKTVINLIMSLIASVWSVQYVLWNITMNVKSNVFRFPVVYAVFPIAILFISWSIYSLRDLIIDIKTIQHTDTVAKKEVEI